MQLEEKGFGYALETEYYCDLTRELDCVAGIEGIHKWYKHYILGNDWCKDNKCLAIRIPGGTVGGIRIDDNNIINEIKIDTNYVIKTYPENVNELMKKYIGMEIKF